MFADETQSIETLKLSVTWKGQGDLKIVLVNGPDEVMSEEVFGRATHDWEDREIELTA